MSENIINDLFNKFIKNVQETGNKGKTGKTKKNDNNGSVFSNDIKNGKNETPTLSDLAFGNNGNAEEDYDYDYPQQNNKQTSNSSNNSNSGNNTNINNNSSNINQPVNNSNNNLSSSGNTSMAQVAPVNLTGNESVDELKASKADIEKQISDTESQNAEALEAAQGQVEEAQTAYDEALEAAESQDEEIQAQIDDIQTRKDDNETAISNQQGVINGINSNISEKESEISDIKGQLSSLSEPQKSSYAQTDANGNTTYPGYDKAHDEYLKKKNELEEKLSQAEKALSDLQSSLTDAEATLSDLEAQGTEIDAELSQLLSEQGNNIQGAEQLQNALQTYQDAQQNLADVQMQQAADSNLQQLQSNLSAIEAAIQEKESQTFNDTENNVAESVNGQDSNNGNAIFNSDNQNDSDTSNNGETFENTETNNTEDDDSSIQTKSEQIAETVKNNILNNLKDIANIKTTDEFNSKVKEFSSQIKSQILDNFKGSLGTETDVNTLTEKIKTELYDKLDTLKTEALKEQKEQTFINALKYEATKVIDELKQNPNILQNTSLSDKKDKLVIGFSTGNINIPTSAKEIVKKAINLAKDIQEKATETAANYTADKPEASEQAQEVPQTPEVKQEEAETTETQQQDEECLIDPIGIENDGVKYDFIVDDGDFDSYEDFLGSSDKGIKELTELDSDGDGTVSGSELAQSNIMVVRTAADGSQTLVSLADVEAELGGRISIDINSIKPAEDADTDSSKANNKNFNVNVTNDNGEVLNTYNGYSEYIKPEEFEQYDYSVDDWTSIDDVYSSASQKGISYEEFSREMIKILDADNPDNFNGIEVDGYGHYTIMSDNQDINGMSLDDYMQQYASIDAKLNIQKYIDTYRKGDFENNLVNVANELDYTEQEAFDIVQDTIIEDIKEKIGWDEYYNDGNYELKIEQDDLGQYIISIIDNNPSAHAVSVNRNILDPHGNNTMSLNDYMSNYSPDLMGRIVSKLIEEANYSIEETNAPSEEQEADTTPKEDANSPSTEYSATAPTEETNTPSEEQEADTTPKEDANTASEEPELGTFGYIVNQMGIDEAINRTIEMVQQDTGTEDVSILERNGEYFIQAPGSNLNGLTVDEYIQQRLNQTSTINSTETNSANTGEELIQANDVNDNNSEEPTVELSESEIEEKNQVINALVTAMFSDPDHASEILISYCGGDIEQAIAIVQNGISNNSNNEYSLGKNPIATYKDGKIVIIGNPNQSDGYETLDNLIQYAQLASEPGGYDNGERLGYIQSLFANNDYMQNYDNGKTTAVNILSILNSMGSQITKDNVDCNSELSQSIYSAGTYENAYSTICEFCGGNEEYADKIFEVLFPGHEKTEKGNFSYKNPTEIDTQIYEYKNGKWVLNQNILDCFSTTEETQGETYTEPGPIINEETDCYDDVEVKPVTIQGTQYFTDIDGNICSTSYEGEIRRSYNSEGNIVDATATYTYTHTYPNGETYEETVTMIAAVDETTHLAACNDEGKITDCSQIIVKRGDEEISLTPEQYLHRCIVEQNYSLNDIPLNAEGNENIERLYHSLSQQDRILGQNIAEYSRELGSQGFFDHLWNGLDSVLSLMPTGQDEIAEGIYSRSILTSVLENVEQGVDVTEQCEEELNRRLSNSGSIQETYEILCSYYGDEKAKEIIENIKLDEKAIKQNGKDYDIHQSLNFDSIHLEVDDNGQVQVIAEYENDETRRIMQSCFNVAELANQYGGYQNLNVETIKDMGIEDLHGPTEVTEADGKDVNETIYNNVYTFWTNGGVVSQENIERYEEVAPVYSSYNSELSLGQQLEEMLSGCNNPSDAFDVFREFSRDDNGEIDEEKAIQLFNSYYSSILSVDSSLGHNGYGIGQITGVEAYSNNGNIEFRYIIDENSIGDGLGYEYDSTSGKWFVSTENNKLNNTQFLQIFSNINIFAQANQSYQQVRYQGFMYENMPQIIDFAQNYSSYIMSSDNSTKQAFVDKYNEYSGEQITVEDLTEEKIQEILLGEHSYEFSAEFINYNYLEAHTNLYGEDDIAAMIKGYEKSMDQYPRTLSRVASMTALAVSLFNPTTLALKLPMVLGFLGDAIDYGNMMSNNQKDDYLARTGQLLQTGVTRLAYLGMSQIAGFIGESGTEWLVNTMYNTCAGSSLFNLAGNELFQHTTELGLEVLSETGLNVGAAYVMSGEADITWELVQNVLYDSLPYVRYGLGKGGSWYIDPNYGKLSISDGQYYQDGNGNRLYFEDDSTGSLKPAYAEDSNGNRISSFEYNADGSYVIKTLNPQNSDEVLAIRYINPETNEITIQSKVEFEDGTKGVLEQELDAQGRVISYKVYSNNATVGNIGDDATPTVTGRYQYDENTGKPTSLTEEYTIKDGNTEIPVTKVTEFDTQTGNKTKSTVVNTDTNEEISSREYHYDKYGKESGFTDTQDLGNGIKYTRTVSRVRGADGKMTQEINCKMTIINGEEIEYTVDSKGIATYTTSDGKRQVGFNESFIKLAAQAGFDTDEFDQLAYTCINDSYGRVSQNPQDDVSCSYAAVLNGIDQNDGVATRFTSSYELVDVLSSGERVYRIGDDEIIVRNGSNIFEATYEYCKTEYGVDMTEGELVSVVLNILLPNTDKAVIEVNDNNIEFLRDCSSNEDSVVIFSTQTNGIKGITENGETVDISANHAYTVGEIGETTTTLYDTQGNKIIVNNEDLNGGKINVATYNEDIAGKMSQYDTTDESKVGGSGASEGNSTNSTQCNVEIHKEYGQNAIYLTGTQDDSTAGEIYYILSNKGVNDTEIKNLLSQNYDANQLLQIKDIAEAGKTSIEDIKTIMADSNCTNNITDVCKIIKAGLTDGEQIKLIMADSNCTNNITNVCDLIEAGLTDSEQIKLIIADSNCINNILETSLLIDAGLTDGMQIIQIMADSNCVNNIEQVCRLIQNGITNVDTISNIISKNYSDDQLDTIIKMNTAGIDVSKLEPNQVDNFSRFLLNRNIDTTDSSAIKQAYEDYTGHTNITEERKRQIGEQFDELIEEGLINVTNPSEVKETLLNCDNIEIVFDMLKNETINANDISKCDEYASRLLSIGASSEDINTILHNVFEYGVNINTVMVLSQRLPISEVTKIVNDDLCQCSLNEILKMAENGNYTTYNAIKANIQCQELVPESGSRLHTTCKDASGNFVYDIHRDGRFTGCHTEEAMNNLFDLGTNIIKGANGANGIVDHISDDCIVIRSRGRETTIVRTLQSDGSYRYTWANGNYSGDPSAVHLEKSVVPESVYNDIYNHPNHYPVYNSSNGSTYFAYYDSANGGWLYFEKKGKTIHKVNNIPQKDAIACSRLYNRRNHTTWPL
ncbi:hypothetical protein IJ182_07785 [bacterium]|nr:hypothetical protein [bacterium]